MPQAVERLLDVDGRTATAATRGGAHSDRFAEALTKAVAADIEEHVATGTINASSPPHLKIEHSTSEVHDMTGMPVAAGEARHGEATRQRSASSAHDEAHRSRDGLNKADKTTALTTALVAGVIADVAPRQPPAGLAGRASQTGDGVMATGELPPASSRHDILPPGTVLTANDSVAPEHARSEHADVAEAPPAPSTRSREAIAADGLKLMGERSTAAQASIRRQEAVATGDVSRADQTQSYRGTSASKVSGNVVVGLDQSSSPGSAHQPHVSEREARQGGRLLTGSVPSLAQDSEGRSHIQAEPVKTSWSTDVTIDRLDRSRMSPPSGTGASLDGRSPSGRASTSDRQAAPSTDGAEPQSASPPKAGAEPQSASPPKAGAEPQSASPPKAGAERANQLRAGRQAAPSTAAADDGTVRAPQPVRRELSDLRRAEQSSRQGASRQEDRQAAPVIADWWPKDTEVTPFSSLRPSHMAQRPEGQVVEPDLRQQVQDALEVGVLRARQTGRGSWDAVVTLSPPDLGQVQARVTLDQSRLTVVLAPSNEAAATALRQSANAIATAIGPHATVTVDDSAMGQQRQDRYRQAEVRILTASTAAVHGGDDEQTEDPVPYLLV